MKSESEGARSDEGFGREGSSFQLALRVMCTHTMCPTSLGPGHLSDILIFALGNLAWLAWASDVDAFRKDFPDSKELPKKVPFFEGSIFFFVLLRRQVWD